MNIASVIALRGTCPRAKVGAVLAKEGRIISTGYNGSPSGTPHCEDAGCILDKRAKCTRTVHAELNCICFAAKHGIVTKGATLYVTYAPCLECAKAIINAGIKEVFYLKEYIPNGCRLLQEALVGTKLLYIIPDDLSSNMKTILARRNKDGDVVVEID
jgi:dCMP deaminase